MCKFLFQMSSICFCDGFNLLELLQPDSMFVVNDAIAVSTSENIAETLNPLDCSALNALNINNGQLLLNTQMNGPVRDESFNTSHIQETHEHERRDQLENRRFACSVCEKRFKQFDNLKRHMITHSGMKPFSCDQCSKSFARVNHLQRHKNAIHLKLRPYVCNMCDKSFTRSEYFKRHMHTKKHTKKGLHTDAVNNLPNVMVYHGNQLHTGDPYERSYSFQSHLEIHKNPIHL